MKKIVISIMLASVNIILSPNKSFSEELIKNTGGELSQYIIKNSPLDSVSELFKSNKNKDIKITKNNLIISDDVVEREENGSIKIKLNIFNRYVMDGFMEIHDKSGRIVDIKLIEGNSAPDNLKDATINYVDGAYNDLYQYGFSDPRSHAKRTELEFTLEPGQTANFSTSSTNVLVYNGLIATFDSLSLAIPEASEKNLIKKLSLDFIKDLVLSESKSILSDTLIKTLSEDTPIEEKLKSEAVHNLFEQFNEYLNKRLKDNSIDNYSLKNDPRAGLLAEHLLDVIGPAGILAKGTFKIANIANIILRLDQARNSFSAKFPSLKIESNISEDSLKYYQNPRSKNVDNNEISNIASGLLDANSCITQVGSSHISSASCYFKSSNQPVQDEVITQFQENQGINTSIQEANQYTNGQIVRAPLDIGLTWNQSTNLDLDSHLVTPSDQHIYYAELGALNAAPNAFLYRDSIPPGRVGAEQTRIDVFQAGIYRFYVHNFSDYTNSPAAQAAGPAGLANANAEVRLYEGGSPLTNIPNDPNTFDLNNPNVQRVGNPYPGDSTFVTSPGQQGNTWYVFRLDTRTGILTRVNQYGNVASPATVPQFHPTQR
jgi:hypothetical protein